MAQRLTRDELEDRLDTLEAAVDDLKATVEQQARERAEDRARMTQLEAENDELRAEVAELRSRVDPDPTGKDYDEMTRDERVQQVRVAVGRKALQNGGKARYRYDDVLAQFNQRPSDGYAYKLLEIAAAADGFEYSEHHGQKALAVDLDAVNDDSVLKAITNGSQQSTSD